MKANFFLILAATLLVSSLPGGAIDKETRMPYVRLAELEIDPAQLESFKAAATEVAEASVRVEPGVLALYSVYVKDCPDQIRVLEMYSDTDAYKAHLETPHFRKFADTTRNIVKSRKLMDVVPISLSAKAR